MDIVGVQFLVIQEGRRSTAQIEFQRAEWKGRMAEKVRHRAVWASGDDRYSGLWSVLVLVL